MDNFGDMGQGGGGSVDMNSILGALLGFFIGGSIGG